jgi:hypothetical protein
MTADMEKRFHITSVTREDVISAMAGALDADGKEISEEGAEKIASALSDFDMEVLASRMADGYIEQMFWEQIRILVPYS